MANHKSNYPTTALDKMNGSEFVGETVSCLVDLNKLGRCKTDEELEERIEQYFQFCRERAFRPGIETLCMSLGITRKTLFMWCQGKNASPRRQELAVAAKQTVVAFIEAATLSGRLNPASSCFLLKNWANYQDSVTVETTRAYDNEYILPGESVRELVTKQMQTESFGVPGERAKITERESEE